MYDYVIVGAGSAGCVLAERLSRDPSTTVCLLEAGKPDKAFWIHWPVGTILLLRSKVLNWAFYTRAQKQLGNRRLFWPRGKMLGGSSSMNGMIYIRGDASDFDHWAELGNRGWAYKDVLPVFRRVENQERGADDFHGAGGGLNVADLREVAPAAHDFVAACEKQGIPRNPDFNGPESEGCGYFQVTQKGGERWSSARANLRQAEDRDNLTVVTQAHATKVLFEGKRAVGVAYRHKGAEHEARAAREVLLSGGAINSPQLLLLSGVGPRAELERHGIEQRHELPGVGENLQDHLDILINVQNKKRDSFALALRALPRATYELFKYLFTRQGRFTSNIAEAGAFTRTRPELERADVQYHFFNAFLTNHALTLTLGYGYAVHCCALRPYSRGRITLASGDPMADPDIDAGYLTDERDMQTMVDGFKLSREILSQPPFDHRRGKEAVPGSKVQSDDEIREFIRNYAETIYHPVGSCKMGHDDQAVVDDRLRVHGLENLRVIDASIMPTLVGGNTNAATIMIADKAAEMIQEDHQPAATQAVA